MAKKMLLFQWIGFAPRWARDPDSHHIQVQCAAVFPSQAAFKRATNSPQSRMPWVGFAEIRMCQLEGGLGLAVATPGVVFFNDTLRRAPKDAEWLIHDNPEIS